MVRVAVLLLALLCLVLGAPLAHAAPGFADRMLARHAPPGSATRWWFVDPEHGSAVASPGARSLEAARAAPVRYIETALEALGSRQADRRDAVIVLRASGDDTAPVVHLPPADRLDRPTAHLGGFRGLPRQDGAARPTAIYIVGEQPTGALIVGPPPPRGPDGRCAPGQFSVLSLGASSFHVHVHNVALALRTGCNDSRAVKVFGPGVADLSANTGDIVLAGLRFPANLPPGLGAVAATPPLRSTQANGVSMFGSIFGSPQARVTGASRHTGNTNWTFRYNEIYDTGAAGRTGEPTILRSKTGSMGAEVTHNIIDSLGDAILIEAGGTGFSSTDATCRRDCQRLENWFFDMENTAGNEVWRDFGLATPGYPRLSRFAEGARWADWTGREDAEGRFTPARIAFNILRGPDARASITVLGAYGLAIENNFVESTIRFEQSFRALHRNHPVTNRIDFSPAIPASQAGRVNFWGGDRPAPGAPDGSGRFRRADAPLSKTNAIVHPAMRVVIWAGNGEVNIRDTCAAFHRALVEFREGRTLNRPTVVVGPEAMNPVPALWESGAETGTVHGCDEASFRARHADQAFGVAGWDVTAIYRHLGMPAPASSVFPPLDFGPMALD